MSKVAIVTDSNSGITQEEGKRLGVAVLPMPFFIDEKLYLEDISLSQEKFYEELNDNADISTSQPSPGDVLDIWDELLKEYDFVVHIPMSSSLSSTCETAMMLANDYDGKVEVVDNKRISITQKQSVLDAIQLVAQGKTAKEIKEILEKEQEENSIYIMVDTLKFLKKGGRITPAAAAIGTVLNLKPVLQIQGGKLDAFAKVRGIKQAKRVMLDAMEKDISKRFEGKEMCIDLAYTCTQEEATQWENEIKERFPGRQVRMEKLSLSVACHTGPGCLAIACAKPL